MEVNRSKQREPGSFSRKLEEDARALRRSGRGWSPRAMLSDEIALVLEQVARHRKHHSRLLEELLETECQIGTELLSMEARTARYAAQRFPERESMKRRKARLQTERRHLSSYYQRRLDALHRELLSLVGKRRVLGVRGRNI